MQIWYADDATGVGKLVDLRTWWDRINSLGPAYGYFPNAMKSRLVTKEKHYSAAIDKFAGTDVKVTSEGRPYLGTPIGTSEFVQNHIMSKV